MVFNTYTYACISMIIYRFGLQTRQARLNCSCSTSDAEIFSPFQRYVSPSLSQKNTKIFIIVFKFYISCVVNISFEQATDSNPDYK